MKRTTMTVLAALGTTVALAGCGGDDSEGSKGQEQDPKAAVMQAFEKESQAKDSVATMSLDVDSQALKNFVTTEGDALDGQTQMVLDKMTELLPKSKVTISQHSRDQALGQEQDVKDLDSATTFHVGEATVEMRQVEGAYYLRADVEKLGQETGLFTADQVKMMANGGSSAAADDPSTQVLNDLVAGKWVGISAEQVEKMAKQQGVSVEELVQQSTEQQIPLDKQAQMRQDLKGFMDEHGEFTREGDVVKVAVPLEKSWNDFAAIANKYATDEADKMPKLDAETKKSLKDDAKGVMDVTLDGEELKGISMDFRQVTDWVDPSSLDATEKKDMEEFEQKLGDSPLTMKTEYGQGDAPAKPDQFTEVPQQLLDQSASSAAGAASSQDGGATTAG